jgi:nitronate monooxygenase
MMRVDRKHPWRESKAAQRLGVRYPLIQGPFGGLSSVALAASVSNSGGLGSFGAAQLSPTQITETVVQLRESTDKPFSLNLWVSTYDEAARSTTSARIEASVLAAQHYFAELNIPTPEAPKFSAPDFNAQVDALLQARPPVASFIFGIPPKSVLEECRASGIVTIGSATTGAEAKAVADAGMDLVVASGFEAGGHRGSFLAPAEASLTGTFALIPQVADNVGIPVIAAGGIADARGIVAAFALGADAVQIGTAFLVCEGSGIGPLHRQALLSDAVRSTGLSRYFSGRLARGIRNRFMSDMEESELDPLPYPLQRALMRPYTEAATRQERTDLLPLWAGQAAALIRHTTVEALMESLIRETDELYRNLSL